MVEVHGFLFSSDITFYFTIKSNFLKVERTLGRKKKRTLEAQVQVSATDHLLRQMFESDFLHL